MSSRNNSALSVGIFTICLFISLLTGAGIEDEVLTRCNGGGGSLLHIPMEMFFFVQAFPET